VEGFEPCTPVMVTAVPAVPLVGEKPVTLGLTSLTLSFTLVCRPV